MKILQIHKDFQVIGGASRYFFEVSRLLKESGHHVAFFSTLRKGNEKSIWSPYFIPYLSYAKIYNQNASRLFFQMMYSPQARKNIALLLDNFQPDIVHLHSIYHQLSPSIIYEIYSRNIPIVQTIHDFHLIAPNHTLFHNGTICEITKAKQYWKAIPHKCIKNSYIASFADALEHYIHDASNIYMKGVNAFITPSIFYRNTLIDYGIPKDKIITIPHFAPLAQKHSSTIGNYVLYFGRLSEEKGLDILMQAAVQLPHIPFKIVGGGTYKIKGLNNVSLIGYKKGNELQTLIQNCRFVILPSLCYENCPISILEAFANGKPVVASRIGGIPELIKNKINGLLFVPGNVGECRDAISTLWNDKELNNKMGNVAMKDATSQYNEDKHYSALTTLYHSLLS